MREESNRGYLKQHFIIFSLGEAVFELFYLFIFRKRGREGERVGEEHQCEVACNRPTTGDLADNPSMYPDWGSNR